MTQASTKEPLAIAGGEKHITQWHSKPEPKIGVEEFFAIAKRFGFTPEAMARLEKSFTNSDLQDNGPNLARYWSTFPKPASGVTFEETACKLFGSPFALGVSSGTAALHAAMVGVGAGPGKEVIVPSLGFVATAAAVALTGATPVFCDVDHSLQMDPKKIAACITPRTVAVAPTHHWGIVADMTSILTIAREHGLKVVEDCAQSPGAKHKGQFVGTMGDVGCFSISCYKIIGGGEGGLVLAKDQKIFDRINQLAESGGLWRPNRFAPERYPDELFVGTNYRMSELEATVDIVQLHKLNGIVSRYRHHFTRIASRLLRVREIIPQSTNDSAGLVGYQLRFFPENHELRAKLVEAMKAEGLPVSSRGAAAGPDWHTAHDMFPIHLKFGNATRFDQCPLGNDLYYREITLAIDQWWTDQDADNVTTAMNKVLGALCTPDASANAWL